MSLWIIVLALVCAFVMGYALNQGSTCAVTAARELIDHRRARMTIGFAIAVAVAGLVWLPLAWLGDGAVTLSGGVPISADLIAGAVLLGMGALINDACLLGTLSRIGHGEVRFLALPLGLALGFTVADRIMPTVVSTPIENSLSTPSLSGAMVVFAFLAVIVLGVRAMRHCGDRGNIQRWSLWSAMMVLGLTGAVLFALAPGWTYADFVHRGVSFWGGMRSISGLSAMTAAVAMVLGALAAGIIGRTFVYRAAEASGVLRSIAGGMVMAVGIVLVPGGNDTVLLSELPALTTSGLVGFTVMTVTVTGMIWGLRRLRRPVAAPSAP